MNVPAPHKGGEDGGADGVDGGNTDAGDQHGGGQGDVHMEQAVGGAHAHAGGLAVGEPGPVMTIITPSRARAGMV